MTQLRWRMRPRKQWTIMLMAVKETRTKSGGMEFMFINEVTCRLNLINDLLATHRRQLVLLNFDKKECSIKIMFDVFICFKDHSESECYSFTHYTHPVHTVQ